MARHNRPSITAVAGIALLVMPLLLFAALVYLWPEYDRAVVVPTPHFWIVSAAALTALLLALLVGIAAVRTREPQALLAALGFLCVAGIFAVHGLTTPGALLVHEFHHSLVISARLSLFVGAFFFLASTYVLPSRLARSMRRRQGAIMAVAVLAVGLYIVANVVKADLLDFVPTGAATRVPANLPAITTAPNVEAGGYDESASAARQVAEPKGYDESAAASHDHVAATSSGSLPEPPVPTVTPPVAMVTVMTSRERVGQVLGYGMALMATIALLTAAWRFAASYPLTRSRVAAAMAIGMVLLAESQVIMALGVVWHYSWWIYHVSMLTGFLLPVAAIGLAYRRGSSLAEIVDGLFLRDALGRIERSFPETINSLVSAIELKDPYLRGHMRRVCELTVEMSRALSLAESSQRTASFGALLHDIGKFGIPDAILHKPSRLTDAEFATLKEHPGRGHEIVLQASALAFAAPVVRWHHERLDGTGYPDHLAGDAIPVEARVVAVADVWDALTSDRVYRDAMKPDVARKILLSESGSKLDPMCVDALLALVDGKAINANGLGPASWRDSEPERTLLAG